LTISRDLRINQMIRIPQVRVVDEEGAQLGVMPTPQALAMAQERGYDLVEVAPMAQPPVARFLDFGQYKYELTKREKEAKRKQRSVTFKEVRLKPKIGGGDFDTKVRRAIEFLEDGDRIKVAVQFRGRELTHPEIGRALLERFTERIKDHGLVERMPLLEGKSMHVTVASTHKPKAHETPQPAGDRGPVAAPKPAATNGQAPETQATPAIPATATVAAPEATAAAPEATAVAPEPTAAPPQPRADPAAPPGPAEPAETAARPEVPAAPRRARTAPAEPATRAATSEAPAARSERPASTAVAAKPRTRTKPAASADTPTAASTGE
jgi:translation initiation factor IF-3